MGSPFPGVDPFLEGQRKWHDFHVAFNVCLREKIMARLPRAYVARIEENVYLDDEAGTAISQRVPDVEIDLITSGRDRERPTGAGELAPGGVGVLEPVVVPNKLVDPIKLRHIEIRSADDDRVVTVVETLSPTNKSGSGRDNYLVKRRELLQQDVNLVELDMLFKGRRIEMAKPLPPGDFYAMISRGDRWPDCEVYAWELIRPLPRIPIPLRAPDPDIVVDLQEAFATTFERGPYDRIVRYDRPIGLNLSDDGRRWVEERLKAVGS
jgi:hypothetical protein